MDINELSNKAAERDLPDPPAMRKIIFLDVDGVLNCDKTERETRSGYRFVGSRKIKFLKKILEETGRRSYCQATGDTIVTTQI